MTARELALASFWTERPLVRLYIERTGNNSFSLKTLIAFAEQLPAHVIATLGADNAQHHSNAS